ncbi:MAG: hypothetical protein R3C15_15795 [Thermoleophilia bacterium]
MPLLEAAFRLFGWDDENEAADALAATPDQVRAWRRGSEEDGRRQYMTLTSIVNVALADAVSRGKPQAPASSPRLPRLSVRAAIPR